MHKGSRLKVRLLQCHSHCACEVYLHVSHKAISMAYAGEFFAPSCGQTSGPLSRFFILLSVLGHLPVSHPRRKPIMDIGCPWQWWIFASECLTLTYWRLMLRSKTKPGACHGYIFDRHGVTRSAISAILLCRTCPVRTVNI